MNSHSPAQQSYAASPARAAVIHQSYSVSEGHCTDRVSLHSQASTLPNHLEGKSVSHDRERSARNIRGSSARPLAYSISQGDWLKRVSKVMREHTGNRPGAAKALADEIECSEKTTQNWLDGRNAPQGILDLRCMHAIPGYAALKRELADMELNLDPRVQAKMQELAQLVMKYGAGE
jgi:hypothetical protein